MDQAARQRGKVRLSRRRFLQTAGMATAGWAVTARAGAGTPGAAPIAAPAKAPTASPAAQSSGREVIMGIGSGIKLMDMRVDVGAQAVSMAQHMLEPFQFPDDKGVVHDILATSVEPVANPPGWRFRLQPGIKFQNGEPLDARSAKYLIESLLDPANKGWMSPTRVGKMRKVKEVRIEDQLTVLAITDGFDRSVPGTLFLDGLLPPKYAAEKGKAFGVHPIGTGHYRFVELNPSRHLVLEADPAYGGHWDGAAKNPGVTFRFLAETATRVAALEAGEVHAIDNVPPDAVARISRDPRLGVMAAGSLRKNGMNFHCGREPFKSLKARLAAVHAVDREAIVKRIMGGMTEVMKGPAPPGVVGISGQAFRPFEYNLNKAKQYFKEAGLTNGTKIRIGGSVGRYTNDKQVATAVAGMLSEVGFAPQLEQLEWGAYWTKVTAGEYDMFYAGWLTRTLDPMEYEMVYSSAWGKPSQPGGASRFQHKRIAEIYDRLPQTIDTKMYERYAAELWQILWDNQPMLYLLYEPQITAINKKLKGFINRRDTYFQLWGTYLE